MNLSIGDQIGQISQEGLAIDAASLYKALEKVKDTRGKKGKRYPLAFILTLILLGKLAGQTKIAGIIYWVDEPKKRVKKASSLAQRLSWELGLYKCTSSL